jgi:hypothetical protein
MKNMEPRDLDLQNFDLLMASGFRAMEEVIIPAWLINVDRRIAFDFEACEAADPQWLRAVLTERVRPGRFAFYLGPDREIDGELCQAILARLLLDDFVADRFRVRAIVNSMYSSL